MTTNARKVNAEKGKKGFQTVEGTHAKSDASLEDVGIDVGPDPYEPRPAEQDLFEYQAAYRNVLRAEYPQLAEITLDVSDYTYIKYFQAVNQLAREGKPITQSMLADLNESNRRYLEQNYSELVVQ